jgi:NADH-quinone oxidoreductase subunit E
MLDMAYIRVLEVATFYTQFQLKPVGTNAHIQICGTTPCMLRGAEQLREFCEHRIHHDPLHTNAEGTLSWEEVECLGACVNAPMVMIGQDTYEDLTIERFEEIVEAFAAGNGKSITPGPQVERQFSAAPGGATTLIERPTAARTRVEFPPAPAPAPAAPATAPAAPAAAPAPTAAAAPPTTPGRKREVSEEAAPALKDPKRAPKVSVAKAEAERIQADVAAKANGKPNRAMRPAATGAESPAGKIGGGKAPGKAVRSVPGEGASPAGTAPEPEAPVKKQKSGVSPTLDAGGKPKGKKS